MTKRIGETQQEYKLRMRAARREPTPPKPVGITGTMAAGESPDHVRTVGGPGELIEIVLSYAMRRDAAAFAQHSVGWHGGEDCDADELITKSGKRKKPGALKIEREPCPMCGTNSWYASTRSQCVECLRRKNKMMHAARKAAAKLAKANAPRPGLRGIREGQIQRRLTRDDHRPKELVPARGYHERWS